MPGGAHETLGEAMAGPRQQIQGQQTQVTA
jgi:hypothetical protein